MNWLIMFIAGMATYGIRLSFILFFDHKDIPPTLIRALRFVPPAVLTAIFVPEMFINNGSLYFSPLNPRLLAGVLAIGTAWFTKNIPLTIIIGMLTLWISERLF